MAPDRALEFAHILQDEHFLNGKDLNAAATYDEICETHGFPPLDTNAIVSATEETPLVAESYGLSTSLGIQSYPTILTFGDDDKLLGQINSEYEPEAFTARFEQIVQFNTADKLRTVVS